MANTYHQIYIQAVFAVKNRAATIDQTWQQDFFGVIGNLINETGCKTIIVNGVYDHVHCFFGLKPTISISEVMQNVKAKSSKWLNESGKLSVRFEWQEGYGVFSYSRSQLDAVYKYVENQAIHHQKQTFQDEYIQFLNKFDIPFDERYIFTELM
jgi:putative transposase